jgi:5-methylcytosine-specific restriction endonuclease McrA
MTTAQILVLNKQWQPVGLANIERAFGLLCSGAAKALDKQYQVFDFASWSDLSAEYGDDVVRTPARTIKVPRVIVLQVYDRLPRMRIRFSRNAIYARDGFTCQYCGCAFPRSSLNLDHVIPKSRGGRTSWTNIVASCWPCNTKKGSRTPGEAGMALLREPKRPLGRTWFSSSTKRMPSEWLPFLDPVSAAYWNAELSDE